MKKLLLLAALLCLLVSPARAADTESGVKIPVLNYHKVADVHIALSIPPDEFARQLQYLADNHYSSVTLDELYAALHEGAALPPNPVMITFDDGYDDNYSAAFPLLQTYGYRAVIFVITDLMGRPGYLTWEQAKEMSDSGLVEIASHTVSHNALTERSDEQIRYEMTKSKQLIEEHLGNQVSFIAYPTGSFNLHVASLIKEAGYRGAFTIRFGNVDRASNLFALERIPIFQTDDTFRSFLERMRYLPVFERIGWAKS